jgi:hypothetical protein
MQTHLYDSDEPGPPHGWLKCGNIPADASGADWEPVVARIIKDFSEQHSDFRESATVKLSPQFWGVLRFNSNFWLYRVLPAGKDRFNRPGRYIIALFCAPTIESFDWHLVAGISSALKDLTVALPDLSAIQAVLHGTKRSTSLADRVLVRKPSDPSQSIETHLNGALSDLKGESHCLMVIENDGTATRNCLDIKIQTTKRPLEAPNVPLTRSRPPSREMPPTSFQMTGKLKIFPLASALLGFTLGYALGNFLPVAVDQRPTTTNYWSDQQVAKELRLMADYLDQKTSSAQTQGKETQNNSSP